MKKSLIISKYNIIEKSKSIIAYYLILISTLYMIIYSRSILESIDSSNKLIVLLKTVNAIRKGQLMTAGLEFISMIFMLILGFSLFKSSFKLSTANNVSKKEYFVGILLSIVQISLIVSVFDLVINRFLNLYASSPTLYEAMFSNFRQIGYGDNSYIPWLNNSFLESILGILFHFFIYSAMASFGILIRIIYYKLNVFLSVLLFIGSLVLFIVVIYKSIMSNNFIYSALAVVSKLSGYDIQSPLVGILTSAGFILINLGLFYLILRKTYIKNDFLDY